MSNIESEFEQHLKTLDKDTLIEWVMHKDLELYQTKKELEESELALFCACMRLHKLYPKESIDALQNKYLRQGALIKEIQKRFSDPGIKFIHTTQIKETDIKGKGE